MSIINQNLSEKIEPISVGYNITSKTISELVAARMSESNVDGYMETVIASKGRGESLVVTAFIVFDESSRDITSPGSRVNNPIIQSKMATSAYKPSNNLQKAVRVFVEDERKIRITRENRAQVFAIDIDICKLLGFYFDVDYYRHELVVTNVHTKSHDNSSVITFFKQTTNRVKHTGTSKYNLSDSINRRLNRQ